MSGQGLERLGQQGRAWIVGLVRDLPGLDHDEARAEVVGEGHRFLDVVDPPFLAFGHVEAAAERAP